jgi:ribosomal protein S18 acetylase RimI-like enzyme
VAFRGLVFVVQAFVIGDCLEIVFTLPGQAQQEPPHAQPGPSAGTFRLFSDSDPPTKSGIDGANFHSSDNTSAGDQWTSVQNRGRIQVYIQESNGSLTMQLSTDINFDRETFLGLEYQASESYNRFAYRDYEQFDMIRCFLFERGLCEFCPPFGHLLVDDRRVVAMMACLSAEDLVRCRIRAALAISQLDYFRQDRKLQQRVRLASTALIKPKKEDFYLARIAVVKTLSRHGIGRYMLGQYEAEARKLGCRRLILEVDPHNEAAVSFYRQASFQSHAAYTVTDPNSGRSLEYLHMAKVLPS